MLRHNFAALIESGQPQDGLESRVAISLSKINFGTERQNQASLPSYGQASKPFYVFVDYANSREYM